MPSRQRSPPRARGRRRYTVTRRSLLRTGAAAGATTVAGCQFLGGPRAGSDDDRGAESTPRSTPVGRTPTRTARESIRFDGGGAEAFSAALRAAEANPGSTLTFEPGTYRLDGSAVGHDLPHSHFTADGLRDVTIEGNGARLVLTDPTRGALGLYNCVGTTLRNLEIDYDPPPFTQGTITAVDPSAATLEVELQPGFPGLDSPILSHPDLTATRRWATVHDPATGDFLDVPGTGPTHVKFDGAERTGGRRYRLTGLRTMRGLEPGRILVVVARWPFKHGIAVFNCVEPTLTDLALRTSPAFAVLIALSEAPIVRAVTVAPRPDSERVVASTADGIHVLNCAPGPTIEDCHMERLQDDAYVVAALMNPVQAVLDDRRVRVDPVLGTRIRPGDDLAGIGARFERLGSLPAVESVETTPLGLPGDWGRPVVVTFGAPVAGTLEAGDFLRNRSRSNQGFAIRNCVSREVRPRHVRVTARDGVVEGNVLEGCAMPAVMLAGGTFFAPQSPPEQVTVRDNTIRRAGTNGFTTPFRGAIEAWVHLGRWQSGPRPPGQPIRNLTVAGNAITESAFRGVQVADAEEVAIRANTVGAPNQVGLDGDDYGFGLVNVRAVRLVGNRVRGSATEVDGFAVQTGTSGLELSDNELVVDGESETPTVVDRS